jgi:hypothetical protein
LDVRDRIYRQLITEQDQPPVTWQQLQAETGLDAALLKKFEEMNLIFRYPDHDSSSTEPLYHRDNIVIGRLFKRAAEIGIPMETLVPAAENLRQIAEFEVNAFTEHVAQRMIKQGESADVIWATIQIGMDIAHSLVSLLHLHTLYRLIIDTRWPGEVAQKLMEQLPVMNSSDSNQATIIPGTQAL